MPSSATRIYLNTPGFGHQHVARELCPDAPMTSSEAFVRQDQPASVTQLLQVTPTLTKTE